MCSNRATRPCTASFSQQTERLWRELQQADAVLVGAGAGLSAAGGLVYGGARFMQHFADFARAFGLRDMYSAAFYPYPDAETHWAYWSRHIWLNRYAAPVGAPYRDLLELVAKKDYFVLTTNVDHQFQKAGFEKQRLFYTQGDYGLWQCARPCHSATHDNEQAVRRMMQEQSGMRIPAQLVPRCPVCGGAVVMNLRCDERFVEDEGWHAAWARYQAFLQRTRGKRLLLLELGVGMNTPGIIKYPFQARAVSDARATYACIDQSEPWSPRELEQRALCIRADLGEALAALRRI